MRGTSSTAHGIYALSSCAADVSCWASAIYRPLVSNKQQGTPSRGRVVASAHICSQITLQHCGAGTLSDAYCVALAAMLKHAVPRAVVCSAVLCCAVLCCAGAAAWPTECEPGYGFLAWPDKLQHTQDDGQGLCLPCKSGFYSAGGFASCRPCGV